MASESKDKIGLVWAFFGLVLEPGVTTGALYRLRTPPYAITLIFSLIVTVFVPIVAQVYKYGFAVYRIDMVVPLFIIFTFTFFIFVLLESLLLTLLGVDSTVDDVIAATGYALAPMIVAIWLLYFFNYLNNGSLTFVAYLLEGASGELDSFIRIAPLAFIIAQAWVILVFYYSMKAMGELGGFSALLITIVSLLPLTLSLFFALNVAEIAQPGTIDIFQRIIESPKSVLVYR